MDWYLAYLLALALLWAFSSLRDRTALRVLLIAGVGSHLLMASLRWMDAPWKLVFPALVETITILALLRFSPNRTAFMQVGLLLIAWTAHALCYYDLATGKDIIYSHYETVLGWVAIGQLLACYDTLRHNWNSLVAFLAGRGRVVRLARGHASILHSPGRPSI